MVCCCTKGSLGAEGETCIPPCDLGETLAVCADSECKRFEILGEDGELLSFLLTRMGTFCSADSDSHSFWIWDGSIGVPFVISSSFWEDDDGFTISDTV